MFAARSRVAIFLSVLFSSVCPQAPAQSQQADVRPRLVSAAEGEAIVQAAWELRHGLTPKPDCSHFVHAVYTRAGFLYEYAASREVFAGVSDFRRVRKPQPGDLVVWEGHIGIVIDPREHSFYSSVLSGFAIENYQSNYWLRRGYPRFYRFVVNPWRNAPWPVFSNLAQVGLASNQALFGLFQPFPASVKPAALMVTAPSPAHRQQSVNTKTEPSAQTTVRAPAQRARASAQIQGPASVQMKPEASGQMKAEASGQTKSRQMKAQASGPMKLEAAAPVATLATVTTVATKDPGIHDEVLVTSRATPLRHEVLAAIIRSADVNGERLLRDGQLESRPSVGVVDRFTIVALDVQGNVGLADLEVKEMAAFRYGTARPYRLTVRQRVILSRQAQGWVLLDPQNLVYLNRRLAARALSHQLAAMPPGPAGQHDVRTAVKILHELLATDAGGSD